jgi:hypothetical protein
LVLQLACVERCYPPTVPTFNAVFCEVQYVWFMVSRATSCVADGVVGRGGINRTGTVATAAPTATALSGAPLSWEEVNQLLERVGRLLPRVALMYGDRHEFCASLGGIYRQLLQCS